MMLDSSFQWWGKERGVVQLVTRGRGCECETPQHWQMTQYVNRPDVVRVRLRLHPEASSWRANILKEDHMLQEGYGWTWYEWHGHSMDGQYDATHTMTRAPMPTFLPRCHTAGQPPYTDRLSVRHTPNHPLRL